ncbi:MAG: ABC transporter ATP-binding protein [Calditrichaeota bacterium]|jgi:ABC-2 type transport system ATP-binding protein|nr:ABC transporter ATP-binding protein [Calditrichota bacterium]MBT7789215.1 ABC transporter ATP-binding protein [Calditrichota bacterium]
MASLEQNTDNTAVLIQNLTRKFGKFVAVDNINLTVSRGEIFGFLGANGAGKTTAIRMLCGILRSSGGNAWVAGIDINKKPELVKRKIGYMSQKFSLYNDLTISENLTFYGGIYGLKRKVISQRSRDLLDRLKLVGFRNRMTGALPLGYKQRLALGCSVLHRPRVLFLDEPTGGVDPVARREFWDLIYELSDQGTTIFVTTHYMDEAEYCNRVSIMDQGRIIALGKPTELKQEHNVKTMQEVFFDVVQPVIT